MNPTQTFCLMAALAAGGAAQAAQTISYDLDQGATDVYAGNVNLFSPGLEAGTDGTASKVIALGTADVEATALNPAVHFGWHGSFSSASSEGVNANVVRIVNGAEASSYTDALVFLTPNTTEVDAGGSQTTRGLALFPTTGAGAIDASSSFAAAVGRQNFITDGFTHRWVVVNDGAYYVSDAAVAGWNPFINRTIDGLTALALADPAGATWYPWTPGSDLSTATLGAGVVGSTLETISFVGIHMEYTALKNNQMGLAQFSATLAGGAPPPEPPSGIVVVLAGSDLELSFQAASGFSYQLQSSATMAEGTWAEDGDPIAGDDTLQVITRAAPVSGKMFYRLDVTAL